MSTAYVPVPGSRLTQDDAAIIGSELERMGPEVRPESVVDRARDPASPLHRFFEWDDARAADEHRIERARYLIRSVRVVIRRDPTDKPRQVRGFVMVQKQETRSYAPVVDVMSNEEYRQQLVARALAELQAWRRRYHELHELAELFAAVDSAQGRLDFPETDAA